MKILVTGCAGFIGANFCEYILDNYPSDVVIGVDCISYAANIDALEGLKNRENFRFYKENICDVYAIDMIFSAEKPDVVINFAAESHVDNSISDASVFVKTNVLGTQVLLDASMKYGVGRFHQVSTDEVYGDLHIGSDKSFDENAMLNPSSPYSASKAAADLLAMSYMRTHGLPVSISRSSNNYGKYQHTEKLIPMTIKRILSGEPVPLYGDGSNVRDWLYVMDNCSAIDTIVRKGKCEIYNIGADNPISNIELVKKIMTHLGMPNGEITFVEDRKGHDKMYSINSAKIRDLGWCCVADFDTELRDTVEWYKARVKKEID